MIEQKRYGVNPRLADMYDHRIDFLGTLTSQQKIALLRKALDQIFPPIT